MSSLSRLSIFSVYLLINPCYSGISSSVFSPGAGRGPVSCSRDTSSTTYVASCSVSFLGLPSSAFFASFSFFIFSSYSFILYFFYYSKAAFFSASVSSTGLASAFVSFSFANLINSFLFVCSI
jgi:hypothetical protein